MSSLSVLTRKGVMTHEGLIDNKCRSSEWNTFHYEIKLVFGPTLQLDQMGFVVDHHEIDEEIRNELEIRSCELICDDVIDVVRRFLKKNKLLKHLLGIRIQIKPEIPELR